MELLHPALAIVLIIVWLVTLVWVLNDVSDQFGCNGCMVFALIYILLFPIFPLVIIGYLLLKAQWQGSPPKPRDRSEQVTQFNWRTQQQSSDERTERTSTPAVISAAESNDEIDLLLAEGKMSKALDRANELYEMAKSFGDASGMKRYRKYIDYIHSGGH
jgi:flagellar biosynthesis component FlhA